MVTQEWLLRPQLEAVRAELVSVALLIAQQEERSTAEAVLEAAELKREMEPRRAEAGRWRDQARSLEDRVAEARAETARRIARPHSGQFSSALRDSGMRADFVSATQPRRRATAPRCLLRSRRAARRTLALSDWSSER